MFKNLSVITTSLCLLLFSSSSYAEMKEEVHEITVSITTPVIGETHHIPGWIIVSENANLMNEVIDIPAFDSSKGTLEKVEIRTKQLSMNSGSQGSAFQGNGMPGQSKSGHAVKISLLQNGSFNQQLLLKTEDLSGGIIDYTSFKWANNRIIMLPDQSSTISNPNNFVGTTVSNQIAIEVEADVYMDGQWYCQIDDHYTGPETWVCTAFTASAHTTTAGNLEVVYTYTPSDGSITPIE
ncbi:hypothetical protein KS4_12580 [Poriferisphaera corsica]|uniref:Uncharacterized protein n=1 Tax=Poriferisphaera corsica TaxID=2528020 RepID=A0A517YSJ6_9BACT|nr:hypothetical protein [Poriferisphaera corsica]QDU33213.1 hypothetical protein KS4_12580 [Poriferisphaera corsica]